MLESGLSDRPRRLQDFNIVLESLGANVGIGAAWAAGDVQISKTLVLQGFGLDSVLPGSRTPYKPNASNQICKTLVFSRFGRSGAAGN